MEVWTLGKGFLFRLAKGNVVRSRRDHVPYGIAVSLSVAIFFIIVNLIHTDSIPGVPASERLTEVLGIGQYVISFVVLALIVYFNSFLIRKRSKEFALYTILGLEKRHISALILMENLIVTGSAFLVGTLGGMVFGKLLLLALMKLLASGQQADYQLSSAAFLLTGILSLAAFFLTSVINNVILYRTKTVDLMKSERKGETVVKYRGVIAALGTALLLASYYTAVVMELTSRSVMMAYALAVLGVILGTYLLFIAGSDFIIARLKKNRTFYYRSNNFIALASLQHRMKQNALGLAAICILSTMVLTTISMTFTTFSGLEGSLKQDFPNDMVIQVQSENDDVPLYEDPSSLEAHLEALAKEHGVSIEERFSHSYETTDVLIEEGKIRPLIVTFETQAEFEAFKSVLASAVPLKILILADYNALEGTDLQLKDREVLLVAANQPELDRLSFPDSEDSYRIKSRIVESRLIQGKNSVEGDIHIVVKDYAALKHLMSLMEDESRIVPDSFQIRRFYYNLNGKEEDLYEFSKAFFTDFRFEDGYYYSKRSIFEERAYYQGIYGGLVVLGVFFAILFLSATVLIIYFKQISEGEEDRERFQILQKVGLSTTETKRTINKQILIVFFLPLVTAIIHLVFARKMIYNLITTGIRVDPQVINLTILVTALVFGLVYTLIYKATARAYYRIVLW
jgi:putative ABC transport system permease protein